MDGRVFTRSLEFQTKQHSILGLDLGDGVDRDLLFLGGVGTAAWFGALTLLFGLPTQQTIMVYVTLPIVVFYLGFQPDSTRERRKKLTTWILWFRYALVGHRPIINGAITKQRGEYLDLQRRFDLAKVHEWFTKDEVVWEPKSHEMIRFPEAASLDFTFAATLIGFDAMQQVRTTKERKTKSV